MVVVTIAGGGGARRLRVGRGHRGAADTDRPDGRPGGRPAHADRVRRALRPGAGHGRATPPSDFGGDYSVESDGPRYAADASAAAAMTGVRQALAACARFEEQGDPGVTVRTTFTVLAEGFAGDDSLAVRQVIERNGQTSNVDSHLVLRQGDLVAAVWLSDQRWTESGVRTLGKRVAARLCAPTTEPSSVFPSVRRR